MSPSAALPRLLLVLLAALSPLAATADDRWQRVDAVRAAVGEAQPLRDGLALELPFVAEDGSSVTLGLSFSGALRPGEYIDSVRVFAPRNPRPEVIELFFHAAAPVNVGTRMRLRESQPVFAVAGSNLGRRWLAVRDVRVTVSGCLAPTASPQAPVMANPRVALAGKPAANQPFTLRAMVAHPMHTGVGADGAQGEPQLVRDLRVNLAGQPLFEARFHAGTAANPFIQAQLSAPAAGELEVIWRDQRGAQLREARPLSF
ncbi:MAG TPA: thiosulfate oxidation carrier protein SoxY [Pseudomonas sp.]|nr:thiosulfate oxidation carrier protein SoxY [Pseudomonas sp.]